MTGLKCGKGLYEATWFIVLARCLLVASERTPTPMVREFIGLYNWKNKRWIFMYCCIQVFVGLHQDPVSFSPSLINKRPHGSSKSPGLWSGWSQEKKEQLSPWYLRNVWGEPWLVWLRLHTCLPDPGGLGASEFFQDSHPWVQCGPETYKVRIIIALELLFTSLKEGMLCRQELFNHLT